MSTVDAQSAAVDERVWVPIAEAARRHGVSRAAMHKRVGRLVEAGRLATRAGAGNTKLVNVVALNRAIHDETDPAQDLRNGRAPVDEPEPEAPETGPTPPGAGQTSYHRSRAEREAYQAENARLDLAERLGRLADVGDIERRTMTVFRKLRDRLLAMPATLADLVAAAPDARAVRMVLTAELRALLDGLAAELDRMDDDDADRDAED